MLDIPSLYIYNINILFFIKKGDVVMEQQKLDMFIMTNKKYFPEEK